MRRAKWVMKKSRRTDWLELAVFSIFFGCLPLPSMAQPAGQKTFSSPQEASDALVAAMQSNDEKAMLAVLGPDAEHVVSSGDAAEDARSRANFVQKYLEMHRLVKEPDGTTTLYIGAKNWPTPIPLAEKGSTWYFDTEAGSQEILFRRIGRNEISTIRVCQELVAAEKEYRDLQHDQYAEKIVSDEGRHNGLYWKAAPGGPQSPVGPLVASAVTEGYSDQAKSALTPYRGYYFHILSQQGSHAPGGAKSYIVDGKMTGGFAFVAYPADYRSSGVMTFVVASDGIVYEKDLGTETGIRAKAMKTYDPDGSWRRAEETQGSAGDSRAK